MENITKRSIRRNKRGEQNIKGLAVSMLLLSVFIIAMINAAINHAIDNQATVSLLDDSLINETNTSMVSSLQTASEEFNNQSSIQSNTNPDISDGITLTSTAGAATSMKDRTYLTFNVFLNLLRGRLGISGYVLGAMMTIVILTFIYLVWRWVRTGN